MSIGEGDEGATVDDQGPSFDLDAFLTQCVGIYQGLTQTTLWRDAHGKTHKIDEMSLRYKINVLYYLRARAPRLHMMVGWGMIADLAVPRYREHTTNRVLCEFDMMGENARDDFDGFTIEHDATDPHDWLEEMPLIRRLSADVLAGEGGASGEEGPPSASRGTKCTECNVALFKHQTSNVDFRWRRDCRGRWWTLEGLAASHG